MFGFDMILSIKSSTQTDSIHTWLRCSAMHSVAATVSTSGSGPPKTAWMGSSIASACKHTQTNKQTNMGIVGFFITKYAWRNIIQWHSISFFDNI